MLIAIAGASGSGKSTLAQSIAASLGSDCAFVSLDSYYHPLDHLPFPERERSNFDHPDALDWDLLIQHLTGLASGSPVEEPVYDFSRHTRAMQTRLVRPTRFLILEGILALHHASVRALCGLKVYVEAPDDCCLQRRMARDIAERGRTPESVERQYEETVRPMAAQFVWPSRQWADLVVTGTSCLTESQDAVLALLPLRQRAAGC